MAPPPTPTVVVFGAGIAGLTVAHELRARGFAVIVYDPAPEPELNQPLSPQAGGLAHTQYHEVANPLTPGAASVTGPLPAEHGFRVFPSFYRHLDDTMRRIPVFTKEAFGPKWAEIDAASPPFEGNRSVADNLVPVPVQGIAFEDSVRLYQFETKMPRTLASAAAMALRSLQGFGYRGADMARFQMKLFQFMSSCARRREQYAGMSFWDFVGGDQCDARFQRHLNSVPRALVAMDAHRGDARTQAQVLVQHLLDFSSSGGNVDRTLNGPTSETWLRHWFLYLSSSIDHALEPNFGGQGVDFRWGARLTELAFDGASGTITGFSIDINDGAGPQPVTDVPFDYLVVALPIDEVARLRPQLITDAMAQADANEFPEDPALQNLLKLLDQGIEATTAWLSGIQIYLREDIRILAGHVYFPDSPWGLSAVSQGQFWSTDSRITHGGKGARGILSVDIANWEAPGEVIQKPANQCTKRELGIEVWQQMRAAMLPLGIKLPAWDPAAPPPDSYVDHHVDFAIVDKGGNSICDCAGGSGSGKGDNRPASDNLTRMTISPPGTFGLRPGPLAGGYKLRLKNLLFAGHYTQTHISLPTMEGANESGRHVANAILQAENDKYAGTVSLISPRYELAAIYPFTDYEPADFDFLKRLDEKLLALGDPHFIEILGVTRLLEAIVPQSGSMSGNPSDLGKRLLDVLGAQLAPFGFIPR